MTNAALRGKPDAGNPHVRFDEGEVAPAATPRRGSLLYKKNAKQDFTPRAEDLTLEDMAKWMEQCAKSAKSNDPRLTAGQNRLLTADIRKGYTRIADALRAYDKILKKGKHS